ncbi:TPA: hypothetical protein P0E33_002875 [Vibrio harveyi]|nr:hypothetical protein [Vibrio harveyi]HDM8180699.1 hypothetical protein [Vibrio harveyi]
MCKNNPQKVISINNFDFKSILLGCQFREKATWKDYARLFIYHDLSVIQTTDDLSITSDLNRDSYEEMFNNVAEYSKTKKITFTSKDVKIRISFFSMYKAIKIYSRLPKQFVSNQFVTIAFIVYAINSIKSLKIKRTQSPSRVICFMPLHGIESIVAQYVRIKGGRVDMYQHALFKNDNALKGIDKIIFDVNNFIYVDRMLLWGMATYNEMKKYLPNRKLKIAGSLYKTTGFNSNRIIESKSILLLLTSDVYYHWNKSLVDYIFEHYSDCNIFVKVHPNSNYSDERVEILSKDISLQDAIDASKCLFAISVNSSAYYDMYRLGVRCFKYEVDEIRKLDSVIESDSIRDDMYRIENEIESFSGINEKLEYFYSNKRDY